MDHKAIARGPAWTLRGAFDPNGAPGAIELAATAPPSVARPRTRALVWRGAAGAAVFAALSLVAGDVWLKGTHDELRDEGWPPAQLGPTALAAATPFARKDALARIEREDTRDRFGEPAVLAAAELAERRGDCAAAMRYLREHRQPRRALEAGADCSGDDVQTEAALAHAALGQLSAASDRLSARKRPYEARRLAQARVETVIYILAQNWERAADSAAAVLEGPRMRSDSSGKRAREAVRCLARALGARGGDEAMADALAETARAGNAPICTLLWADAIPAGQRAPLLAELDRASFASIPQTTQELYTLLSAEEALAAGTFAHVHGVAGEFRFARMWAGIETPPRLRERRFNDPSWSFLAATYIDPEVFGEFEYLTASEHLGRAQLTLYWAMATARLDRVHEPDFGAAIAAQLAEAAADVEAARQLLATQDSEGESRETARARRELPRAERAVRITSALLALRRGDAEPAQELLPELSDSDDERLQNAVSVSVGIAEGRVDGRGSRAFGFGSDVPEGPAFSAAVAGDGRPLLALIQRPRATYVRLPSYLPAVAPRIEEGRDELASALAWLAERAIRDLFTKLDLRFQLAGIQRALGRGEAARELEEATIRIRDAALRREVAGVLAITQALLR